MVGWLLIQLSTRQDEVSENGQVKISERWHLRLWNKDDGSDVEIGPFSLMSLVAFAPSSKLIANGFSIFSTSDGTEQSTLELQAPWTGPIVSQWTTNDKGLALFALFTIHLFKSQRESI